MRKWVNNSSETFKKCDSGFISDDVNGFCYIAFNDSSDFDDVTDFRCAQLDAEPIKFENESQISGLIGLWKNGKDKKFVTELLQRNLTFKNILIFVSITNNSSS